MNGTRVTHVSARVTCYVGGGATLEVWQHVESDDPETRSGVVYHIRVVDDIKVLYSAAPAPDVIEITRTPPPPPPSIPSFHPRLSQPSPPPPPLPKSVRESTPTTYERRRTVFNEWFKSLTSEQQWAHCGNPAPHSSHKHTIVFNEGPYPDVPCIGTPLLTR